MITDQEYIDLVKIFKSNDPIFWDEMVDMIEFCIAKFDVTSIIKPDAQDSVIGIAKESGEPGDLIQVKLPTKEIL